MASDQIQLSPGQPAQPWIPLFYPDSVTVINYSSGTVYVRGNTTDPVDATNYDNVVPPGMFQTFAGKGSRAWSFNLVNALLANVTAINVTERVDIIAVKDEPAPVPNSGFIVRNIAQSISLSLLANGTSSFTFDTRYAHGFKLAATPSSGSGTIAVDILVTTASTPTSFTVWRSFRLPIATFTEPTFLVTLPLQASFVQLTFTEIAGFAASNTVTLTLLDAVPAAYINERTSTPSSSQTGVTNGTPVTVLNQTHDAGLMTYFEFHLETYPSLYGFVITITADGDALTSFQLTIVSNVINFAASLQGIVHTPTSGWCSINTFNVMQWSFPLNIRYNTSLKISVNPLFTNAGVVMRTVQMLQRVC